MPGVWSFCHISATRTSRGVTVAVEPSIVPSMVTNAGLKLPVAIGSHAAAAQARYTRSARFTRHAPFDTRSRKMRQSSKRHPQPGGGAIGRRARHRRRGAGAQEVEEAGELEARVEAVRQRP